MTLEQMDRLDRALAVKFGWKMFTDERGKEFYVDKYREFISFVHNWFPTRLIDKALGNGGPGTVVGEMKLMGWNFGVVWSERDKGFSAEFARGVTSPNFGRAEDRETPALAICLAADAALNIPMEENREPTSSRTYCLFCPCLVPLVRPERYPCFQAGGYCWNIYHSGSHVHHSYPDG